MTCKTFTDLTQEQRLELLDRVLCACKWLRVMGHSDTIVTQEGQMLCPMWTIPHSKYMILLYGEWSEGNLCRFVVLNNESGAACSVNWVFEDDKHIGMVNLPNDLSDVMAALDCFDIMKGRRYQEIEGVM